MAERRQPASPFGTVVRLHSFPQVRRPLFLAPGRKKISTCAQDKTQELPLAQQVTVGKAGSHVVTRDQTTSQKTCTTRKTKPECKIPTWTSVFLHLVHSSIFFPTTFVFLLCRKRRLATRTISPHLAFFISNLVFIPVSLLGTRGRYGGEAASAIRWSKSREK